jgi:hypothetical protein
MIPVETKCLNHMVLFFSTDMNNEELKENLDLVEKVRLNATIKKMRFSETKLLDTTMLR